MRGALILQLGLLLLPLGASAGPAPVIGGSDAPAGKWPDSAAMIYPDGMQGCTGTLIAPTVVLTAEHCIYDGGPTSVVVGAASLARKNEGDIIAVTKRMAYPNGDRTYDIGVLVLAQPSRMTPRPIASGWTRFEIKNAAQVAIVGFGAIDRNATSYVNELQEATTTITDADCSRSLGCNSLAKPLGELGAGGMGIDTCPGDSGGPLYLVTPGGTYLAGVTSRGYDNNSYDCSEGGIYARPDKVVDWIEEVAGVKVARGPEPTFEPLSAVRGHAAETRIIANDPKSTSHSYKIVTQPGYGTAAIRDDGRLRVCTNDSVAGDDVVVVEIADSKDPTRVLTLRMPIIIEDGDPGSGCDPEDFEGGGCCDAGRSAGGSLPLGLGVLLVLRRRRQR
ncbi:MAG: serine protease [Deltaproteobacteria bacterium]|nr:serine protease [Deltaproteobacteria bacterium]